jgi:excisionase family DNA binding protein
MSPETQVLTVAEVAGLLRVPKSTVYKLAQNGTVPAFKVGKHWRFLLNDIEGWLHSQGNVPLISQDKRPT